MLLLLACGSPPDAGRGYPLDDVLTFSDLQAKGTHNSYHVETSDGLVEAWHYSHPPLQDQLEDEGVRQFELDVQWDADAGEHLVFHLAAVDEGTTCETFTACAADLREWSDGHPGHHPLFVLVETKGTFDPATGADELRALDDELLAAWPRERLITPDDVKGDAPDLRTALADHGWPTLGELRGRALFVVHDGGDWRATYVEDLDGRPMFPDAQGDETLPYAAVHTMNDPFDPHIPDVLALGHLVRTRADSDVVEATANDTTKRDQALAVGAHFVSTDFPVPVDWTPYVVEIPGGTPSRCNPVTAPPDCTSADIEDPGDLVPQE